MFISLKKKFKKKFKSIHNRTKTILGFITYLVYISNKQDLNLSKHQIKRIYQVRNSIKENNNGEKLLKNKKGLNVDFPVNVKNITDPYPNTILQTLFYSPSRSTGSQSLNKAKYAKKSTKTFNRDYNHSSFKSVKINDKRIQDPTWNNVGKPNVISSSSSGSGSGSGSNPDNQSNDLVEISTKKSNKLNDNVDYNYLKSKSRSKKRKKQAQRKERSKKRNDKKKNKLKTQGPNNTDHINSYKLDIKIDENKFIKKMNIKNQAALRDIAKMKQQLRGGDFSSIGIGSKSLGKNLFEARSINQARIYYRMPKRGSNVVEIYGYSLHYRQTELIQEILDRL